MKVSETYIKMCEQARELWDGRQFDIDDLVMVTGSEDGMADGLHIFALGDWVELKRGDSTDFTAASLCWGGKWFIIFRQFQLQQMVKRDDESWRALDIRFNSFAEKLPIYNGWIPEQRWLAFVMKEKFNKVWNGNCWIPTKMVP